MKTVLRHFAAAGLALAFSLPAYSQVIGPAPGSGNGGSLTVPSTITGSISGSATTGAIGYGTLGYSDTNNFGAFQTSVNSYAQFVLQNTNAGATASADYIVSNNLGTASTYYGNFGINSSGFTGTGALNQASAVYLTSTSGDLSIGTTTNNAIHFVVNSGATDTATISSAGVSIASGQALNWNSDSGISRLGAASLAIGNGTAGDFSGSLKLTTVTLPSAGSAYPTSISGGGVGSSSVYGLGFSGGTFFVSNGRSPFGVGNFNQSSTGAAGVGASSPFGWASNNAADPGNASLDLLLWRDAANTLALQNGTNAQTFNVYNTFTDASNYERGGLTWSTNANVLTLETVKAGTGTARDIRINSASSRILIQQASAYMDLNGNTLNVGSADVKLASGFSFYWSALSRMSTSVDGNIVLQNQAATSFGLLQLGGTTSSFPAIKRNGAAINFRLADDSADAAITAASISTSTAATFHTTSVALTNGAGASAGTITNAPAVGNPTKWIGINDNGTTRYIPAW